MAFSMADLALVTLNHVTKDLDSAISQANPTWKKLSSPAKRKEVKGGKAVVEQLEIAENGTVEFVDGAFDEVTVQPEDILGEATYPVVWLAGSFTYTEKEKAENSEPWQIKNLLKKKATNLMTTMKNKVNRALFNASPGSKDFRSILTMIPDDPTTGTFAGINRATASFVDTEGNTVYYWRSKLEASVSDTATLLTAMNNLWRKCMVAGETPDLIIMGDTHYGYYELGLTKTLVTNDGDKGYKMDPGFKDFTYKGVPIVYDQSCPAARTYFINTNHMDLYVDPRYEFKVLEPQRSRHSFAFARIVVWRGCVTASSMRHHGVITT